MKYLIKSVILWSLLTPVAIGAVRTLTINSNQADPVPKEAFAELIKLFEKENPEIKVKQTVYDMEAYKTVLRNWLVTSPPDLVNWYAGNRMKQFVSRDLFEDLSDIWKEQGLLESMSSSKSAMTIDGRQWGVPFTYYQWGIYYRKDLFAKFSIQEPKTWQDFLLACETLKKNGVTPITIGTKFLWPAAGWFDYLNLRVNGLAFHMDLMAGKVPYTDARVKEVFAYWNQLIEPGYFLKNHATYSWQEGASFLINGQSAMYLMGNFISQHFKGKKESMGFFPFPQIKDGIVRAEDAPLDTFHIPKRAKNKADAKKFLSFIARKDIQERLNIKLRQIPPHQDAKTSNDPFLMEGLELLKGAEGTAQFYDRDTSPSMAKEGMKGFQEFMVKPERIERILKRLERSRKRVFAQRS